MKNRSFSHRSPYLFKRSIPVKASGMMLRSIRLPSNRSQVELEPILRWEDDGGQMTDAVALQSSQRRADQHEEAIALAHGSTLDSLRTKLLRIQPM